MAIFLFGICAILSSFSKENYLPVLELYAFYYSAFRRIRVGQAALLLSIPLLSVIFVYLSCYCFRHNEFIDFNKSADDSYHMCFRLNSILEVAKFYFQPFSGPIFLIAIIGAAISAFLNEKKYLFLAALSMGLASYGAYLLIPNHKLGYYYWSGMPILITLLPIAFFPTKNKFINRVKNIILVLLCGLVLVASKKIDHAMGWDLAQQNINKNIIDALDNKRVSIQHYNNILICGITFPFHPWVHPGFLKRHLNYSGKWGLMYNKTLIGFQNSELLTVVKDLNFKILQKYDQIFIFNEQVQLIRTLSPVEYFKEFTL